MDPESAKPPKAVSTDEVRAVVAQFHQRHGVMPTQRKARELLGRGSYHTIGACLRELAPEFGGQGSRMPKLQAQIAAELNPFLARAEELLNGQQSFAELQLLRTRAATLESELNFAREIARHQLMVSVAKDKTIAALETAIESIRPRRQTALAVVRKPVTAAMPRARRKKRRLIVRQIRPKVRVVKKPVSRRKKKNRSR